MGLLLWISLRQRHFSFRIPKRLLSDNGTAFTSMHVWWLLDDYGIDCVKTSPYYPQGNSQAEAISKTPLHVLNRMVYEYVKDGLILFLFPSEHILPQRTLQLHPRFSLVYGIKAVGLIEVMVPSAQLTLASRLLLLIIWCGGPWGEGTKHIKQMGPLKRILGKSPTRK